MINLDDYVKENKTQHNLKWPNIQEALDLEKQMHY